MTERSSKKQQELLQFIDNFIKGNGYGPSYREVMRGLGYKSVSTVAIHINGLIEKGYLRKKDHSARSIEVVTLQYKDVLAPTSETSPLVTQLEDEIQKRISKKDIDRTQALVLVEAATILGSERSDELREVIDAMTVDDK